MIKYLKKVFCLLSIVIISVVLFGCEDRRDMSNEDYEIGVISFEQKKIAIGDIKYNPENGAAFIPYTINGYTVTSLGISGTLSQTNDLNNRNVNRIYLPSTIEKIGHEYIAQNPQFMYKLFFCNESIMLSSLMKGNFKYIDIYVPSEYYDDYIVTNDFISNIKICKANVCYYFNLEENDYYYVDYYEENSLIEFIPPNPEKEGYVFDGWYKEKECINKWDFESDTVKLEENIEEIKLYAKWIEE